MEIILPKREEIKKLPLTGVINLLASLHLYENCDSLRQTLYDRFSGKFHSYVVHMCSKSLGHRPEWKCIAEEIFQDTCLLFFEQIEAKNFSISDLITDDIALKKILGWLNKTAYHKQLEYFRNQKKENEEFRKYRLHVRLRIDEGSSIQRSVTRSYDLNKLNKTLSEMKPVEREIILLSHENGCFPTIEKKNTKQFPKELRKNICEQYSIKDDHFRKIKQIAFEKIIACRLQ